MVFVRGLGAGREDRPQLVIEVEWLARPHEHSRSECDLVFEPESDGDDLQVVDAVCLRAESDAGRTGANGGEARDVVGRPLWEHRDHALVAELGLGVLERAAVLVPRSPVDLTMDRDDPCEREQGPDDDDLPERRLGEEPRELAEGVGDEHRIGEAVEVVRDDQRRSPGVQPIEAGSLDPAIEPSRTRSSRSARSIDQGPA